MRGHLLALAPALAASGCLLSDDPYTVPEGPHHRFVVSHLELAATSSRALELGFEVGDDDEFPDNVVGDGLARLAQLLRVSPPALAEAVIAHGDQILLLSLRGPELDGGPLELHSFQGVMPFPEPCTSPEDPVCGHHLDGYGRFLLGPSGSTADPLIGENDRGTYRGRQGHAVLPLALPGGAWLAASRAQAELLEVSPGGFHGRLGGVVASVDFDVVLPPAVGTIARAQLAACPGGAPPACGCTPGSDGDNARVTFDTAPADCVITDDEVSRAVAGFFVPDVDLGEGLRGYSFFAGITAVPADFFIP